MSCVVAYLHVFPDGTVTVPGIDYGNGRKPIVVWQRTSTTITVRVPSGSCWSGVGQPRDYVPATFHVFNIEVTLRSALAKYERIDVAHVASFPVSKRDFKPIA